MRSLSLAWGITVLCIVFFLGCASKTLTPQAALDTPEHHVSNGKKLLFLGKTEDAFYEFNRARELDPKYSPAYLGLGLIYGLRDDFERGFDFLKSAAEYAQGKNEAAEIDVGHMQLFILGKEDIEPDWLNKVEDHFKNAIAAVSDFPDAHYYMGIAYKMSYRLSDAIDQFTHVLEIGKGFVKEANREYAVIQKIERAMPRSAAGEKIALLERISRADAAALFIEELRIEELLVKQQPKTFDASQSPGKEFVSGEHLNSPPVADIQDHVLKAEINAVIAIDIRGLRPFPDHTFKPKQNVTRAEFAIMIEDILVKITRNHSLTTRYVGNNSPFPDLKNDMPYFNAAMVVTTRGIMEARDFATGEFDPHGDVSGVEALLSIRVLETQLQKY